MSDHLVRVSLWRRGTGNEWIKAGELRGWEQMEVEPRHLQPGVWSLSMPYDSQAARVDKKHLITFDLDRPAGPYRLMTGMMDSLSPQAGEDGRVRYELTGVDVLATLGFATCWPLPSAALGSQTVARYQATGNAETVLRSLILANMVTRRGDPLVLPASQNRGTSVTLNERFSNLLAVVAAKAELAGLGFKLGLVNTTNSSRAELRGEFYVPVNRSSRVRLSHKVGTLRTWKQNVTAPAGTRVIVAGGGQGTARVFRSQTDTAEEASWGWSRELFVDARDTSEAALLDERGQEALTEAAVASSFELEAVEAEGMRFAQHFYIGDMVTVELMSNLAVTDRLRAVKVSAGAGGVTVSLIPGNPDADRPLFRQAAIIRALRQQLNALQREES